MDTYLGFLYQTTVVMGVTMSMSKVEKIPHSKGVQVAQNFKVPSPLQCCLLCHVDDLCLSVSYEEISLTCETMNTNLMSTDTVIDDLNWTFFKLTKPTGE